MARKPRSIIIVGGGFSGIVLAANLLRRARQPLDVVLLERTPQLGGPAYAARDYPYLLNVPVGRMSADSRRPEAFLEFARRRAPATGAEDFVPRTWYGDYLRTMLAETEAGASTARLQRVQGEAAHLSRHDAGFRVALRDGRILGADEVVLACGNPPPSQLPAFAALAGHPRYVADGCRESGLQQSPGEVLLVGTGLTMADAALAASARGEIGRASRRVRGCRMGVAEDGIRDFHVTGVQTCALPILKWCWPVATRHPRSCRPLRPWPDTRATWRMAAARVVCSNRRARCCWWAPVSPWPMPRWQPARAAQTGYSPFPAMAWCHHRRPRDRMRYMTCACAAASPVRARRAHCCGWRASWHRSTRRPVATGAAW